MELVNSIYEVKSLLRHPTRSADYNSFKGLLKKAIDAVVLLLTPLAPHLAEELWQVVLGKKNSVLSEPWPKFTPAALKLKQVELAIQVNGKVRARITVASDRAEEAIKQAALADPKVREMLNNQPPKKIIVIPGRLINIVN